MCPTPPIGEWPSSYKLFLSTTQGRASSPHRGRRSPHHPGWPSRRHGILACAPWVRSLPASRAIAVPLVPPPQRSVRLIAVRTAQARDDRTPASPLLCTSGVGTGRPPGVPVAAPSRRHAERNADAPIRTSWRGTPGATDGTASRGAPPPALRRSDAPAETTAHCPAAGAAGAGEGGRRQGSRDNGRGARRGGHDGWRFGQGPVERGASGTGSETRGGRMPVGPGGGHGGTRKRGRVPAVSCRHALDPALRQCGRGGVPEAAPVAGVARHATAKREGICPAGRWPTTPSLS